MMLVCNNLLSQNSKIHRPIYLSDPHSEYGQNCLSIILSKKEGDLIGTDYSILLNDLIPSGSINEVLYFLPYGLDYIVSDKDDILEMSGNLVRFVFSNSSYFSEKEIWGKIVFCLRYVLDTLLKNFLIIELSEVECMKKGWGLEKFIYVKNSYLIQNLLIHMMEYELGYKMVLDLLKELDSSIVGKKWLLELSVHNKEIYNIVGYNMNLKNLDRILDLIDKEYTYWQFIFDELIRVNENANGE